MMTLSGKTFLVTRVQPQAEALAKILEKAGATAILLPTIAIEHLAPPAPEYNHDACIAIVTSAHAAHVIKAYHTAKMTIIAIGPGTQAALEAIGCDAITPETTYNSDGVLALPLLQAPITMPITIFTGENPKPQLFNALKARGARVNALYCYRRVLPIIDSTKTLQQLQRQPIDAIISTSVEGLNNLFRLLGEAGAEWLVKQHWLVISEAMVAAAKQHQITQITLAKDATHEGIINGLRSR